MILNYDDFVTELLDAGFSMGGGNSDGIFSVVPWSWEESPPYDTPVRWHTGDRDTDPWQWRIRVLDERDDIAYAKLFFKKSGYITKEWYPYFLAVRRGTGTFEEEYANGTLSYTARRIYETVSGNGSLPVHIIKQFAGFSRNENSGFERALTELQMRMYLTMCGSQQKLSRSGMEYSWPSTVFCTTESFFSREVFEKAANIDAHDAAIKIEDRIRELNPSVNEKKIRKFISG